MRVRASPAPALVPLVLAGLVLLARSEILFALARKTTTPDDTAASPVSSDDGACPAPADETFFPDVPDAIPFLGPDTRERFAFRHYDPGEIVAGRPMREWLRFSVAYWHAVADRGADPFGAPTKRWPWDDEEAARACHLAVSGEKSASTSAEIAGNDLRMALAKRRMRALFELMRKLGVDRWCFHDRDVAPIGATFDETNANFEAMVDYAAELQAGTSIRPLWGTAQLFKEPHYAQGAATSPDPSAFLKAAAQVKRAMDATLRLGGDAFNFWGGREGYQHLPTTDLALERRNYAAFLEAAARYWNAATEKSLLYGGAEDKKKPLLIEPKPQEPTKHQYDWDVATTAGFLREFGLDRHFALNVECNHATLAGHSCAHETALASAMGALGSLDANTGDPQTGWDTDQFMTDHREAALALLPLVRDGRPLAVGVNFDAKLRRESTDVNDLVHAHVGGMDAFARGLKTAARLAARGGALETLREERYAGWRGAEAEALDLGGGFSLERAAEEAARRWGGRENVGYFRDATLRSGRQELAENVVADAA